MRITHTVSSIQEEASGPAYSVPRLCQSVAASGHTVGLISLGQSSSIESGSYRQTCVEAGPFGTGPLSKLGISSDMRSALLEHVPDVYHTHGLWMMPNVYPAQAAQQHNRPFILTPRGMLGAGALRFSRLKKRAFWILRQRHAVSQVSCFHATAEQEYRDIRNYGLKQPVAVIPNGIDIPDSDILDNRRKIKNPYVLSLGRIHPKKALDRLINAWAAVGPAFPNWRLKIIGPSEVGYAEELRLLANKLGLDSVEISDPVFGAEKLAMLAQADLFALSTLDENFGMTVAESLACGTPVISTKGAPWAGLESNGCGWWVDHGVDPMTAALEKAMSLSPQQRQAMGLRGRNWMEADFSWHAISQQMLEVYDWVVSGGKPPDCVRLD